MGMKAWTFAAEEQCQGVNAQLLKCAPKAEAAHIASSNFTFGPAQCDAMSIMPWFFSSLFGIESLYIDFETREEKVRGCASLVEKPPEKKCINVATFYKPQGSSFTREQVNYTIGSKVRDQLIGVMLTAIDKP